MAKYLPAFDLRLDFYMSTIRSNKIETAHFELVSISKQTWYPNSDFVSEFWC